MSEAEYDETLTSLLLEHGFDYKNIYNLAIPVSRFYSSLHNLYMTINAIKRNLKGGCIFKLSSERENNMFFVFYTAVSSNEIRRRLKLKAFL